MSLRTFCLRIFQHCPLLASFPVENHMRAFEEFLQYKTRVPVRGAILLNEAMDSTVLVKGWKKGANWSFPRGKINKDEDDLDCAVREVYEETGFDIREAGLVPHKDEVKFIEVTMREQQMRLYVFRDVPMDTQFEPKTRKEISKIEWYKLSDLPAFRKKGNHPSDAAAALNANKFYMVAPFLVPLKKWVVQQKKRDAHSAAKHARIPSHLQEEVLTEEDTAAHAEEAGEFARITPAIDTIEGATRELQRLLKVQPPTQGLQPAAPPSALPSAPGQDKGGALLAMLQRSAASSHSSQPEVPQHEQHMPSDRIYAYAPEPDKPQHHAGLRQQVVDHQPPPPFPGPHYTQTRVPPPNAYYRPAPTVPQFMGGGVPPLPSALQQHLPPAVPLMHPQPLPPQVQKTLLNRGMFPSPGVPDTTTTITQQTHIRQGSIEGLIYQQVQGGKVGRPQPNSHAMSLLSAFKGDAPRRDKPQPAHTAAIPHQSAAAPPQQPLNPPTVTNNRDNLLASFFGSNPMGGTSSSNQAAVNGLHQLAAKKPQAPTDQHRSALLEMFKREVPESQRNNAVELDGGSAVSPDIRHVQHHLPQQQQPSYKGMSNGKAIEAAAQVNGGPIKVNPELNLPFGALSILPRPKGDATQGQPDGRMPPPQSTARTSNLAPYSPGTESTVTVKASMQSTRVSTQVPSLVNHGQPGLEPRPPQSQYGRPQHAQQPQPQHAGGGSYQGFQPPQHHSFAAPLPQRPQNTNADQQQQLLSLFAKPQAEDANPHQQQALLSLFGKSQAEDKGKMKEQPGMFGQLSAQVQAQVPRSRLTSLGSAAGDAAPLAGSGSRRGSQTPISPADKNFLLGYLGSAVGGGATAAPR